MSVGFREAARAEARGSGEAHIRKFGGTATLYLKTFWKYATRAGSWLTVEGYLEDGEVAHVDIAVAVEVEYRFIWENAHARAV